MKVFRFQNCLRMYRKSSYIRLFITAVFVFLFYHMSFSKARLTAPSSSDPPAINVSQQVISTPSQEQNIKTTQDEITTTPITSYHKEEEEVSIPDDDSTNTKKPPGVKLILYWNTFFGLKDFTFGFGQQPLIKAQCPVTSCSFTDDRSLFNQSDVIIFSFQNLSDLDLPPYRFPHQRFVFYEMESPENTDKRPMKMPSIRYGFFNWTMTYRLDSDIVNRDSYGIFIPHKRDLPSRFPMPRPLLEDGPLTAVFNSPIMADVIKTKKKLVAWFVSHCKTTSLRENYVKELSKYVPVDIYGKCGNMTCAVRHNCWKMLKTDYKFYIGFENSLCPDYVTEKLTRTFLWDTVPIVLGGVDYNLYAPPHSFINVRDFESPRHLADYLLLLDRSRDLYARYFDWRKDYTVSTSTKQGWCHLCKMANADLPPKIYQDIQHWWIDQAKCLPGWKPKPE